MPAPGPPLPFTQTRRNDIYHDISPYPSGALEGSAAGLTVVITGAGRGLGRSLAIVFAKAGAKVVITSRSAHELDEVEATIQKDIEGATVVKVITDVTDEKSVEALFEKAQDVNVLINNAGTIEGFKPIHEHTPDIWWRTYEVVIRGNFLCTREAIRRALGRNHSSSSSTVDLTIINITSQRSANTTYGNSGYATSKSALNRFTEFIHFEYEAEGVRAFAIHPGSVLTPQVLATAPKDLHHLWCDTPELAAGYALWLAVAGDAVDFLRGRYSSANWDVAELVARRGEIMSKDLLWTRVVGQEQVHSKDDLEP